MNDDERYDGLYLNVAQSARGIEPLLDTMFSFLRRKTDFFAGPPSSDPEQGTKLAVQKVNEVLAKHVAIYNADQEKKKKVELEKKKKTENDALKKEKALKESVAKEEEDVIELSQDGSGFDVSSSTQTQEAVNPSSSKSATPPQDQIEENNGNKDVDMDQEKDEDDSEPPVGNGGTVPGKYVWTQTLQELNVVIPVPNGTRGRNLNVTISKNKLKVILNKTEVKIDSKMFKSVIVDDSFWTLEDGNKLCINLQKLNQMEWWEYVCEEDANFKIDTKKVQPDESKLSDLDGETRQTVVSISVFIKFI